MGALGEGAESGTEFDAAMGAAVPDEDGSRVEANADVPELPGRESSAALAETANPPSTNAALSATDVLAIRLTEGM